METDITIEKKEKRKSKPKWLRVKLPTGKSYKKVRKLVSDHKLHTICESVNCPNMGECWGAGTATFMILGNICTRSCGFCAVATGRPLPVDWSEPEKKRHLLRLWLSLPGDRELPPTFSQAYGNLDIGDRGGVVTKETTLHAPIVSW